MKAKEIEEIESYFKTSNKHWNKFSFEMLCEVFQKGNFENPEIPLKLFSNSIDTFTEHYKTPLMAVQIFEEEANKQNLTLTQKLFVYEWVYKYVMVSDFKKINTNEIEELLKSQIERLKHERPLVEYNKPLTGNIRETLKELMQKELEQLSNTLKELEPVQRLNILCKLIPFVLPKVESVTHTQGEPEPYKKGWLD
jgi:hypothetical protein